MTCDEYRALLSKHLEASATAEEEALLRRHEETCPACAGLRRDMDVLQSELGSLAQAAPDMPEGLHEAWVCRIREDAAMENNQTTTKKTTGRRALTWLRWGSLAAALVFFVWGTILTRDEMPRTKGTRAAATQTAQLKSEPAEDYAVYGYSAKNASAPMMAAGAVNDTADMDMYAMEEAAADYADTSLRTAEVPQVRETKLIRNVSLTIATRTFDESLETLQNLCGELGGWVSYASVSTGSASLRSASLTLRVPADRLEDYLAGSGSTGRVTRQEMTTNDVTDSYYDTQTRLQTQEALMERLRGLVTDAADLSDLLELESQIADTQYYIDSLRGSLQATDQRVRYSTVSITLREEREAEKITSTDLTFGERLSSALTAGLEAFGGFLADMAVFAVAALPFLAAAAVVIIIIVLLVRRSRRRRKE